MANRPSFSEEEEFEFRLRAEQEGGTTTRSVGSERSEQGVPEVSFGEIGKAIKTGTLGKERVAELGGPMKAAYKAASVPSRELTRGLKAIVAKIPDPETRSAAANFALGIPETLGDIGAEMGGGSISPESLLLMAVPSGAISGPLGATAKKMKDIARSKFPAISQALTGVQKKYFARVFEKPGILKPSFMGGPKSMRAAGEGVEAAEKGAFGDLAEATIDEVNDSAATTASQNAIKAAERLKEIREIAKTYPGFARQMLADKETGALMLRGKRGTQFQLDQPSVRGSRAHLLGKQKEDFIKALEEGFPELGPALRDYAESATKENLSKILPVLRSGDPSIARGILAFLSPAAGLIGAGPGGAAAALAPFSPKVNSAAIALTRLGLNQLENIAAKVPQLKSLAVAEIARRRGAANDQ